MNLTNESLFNQARKYIPGGVNSPVRSFNGVGGTPFFTDRASECFLYDSENKEYIDYVCSWGANIVGHANQDVVNKVTQALSRGLSFGTPTELETEFTKEIIKLMPNIEKLRLVSSGTEAVMSAIRLARGYTGKRYIIKFNGCYHGHSDNLLIKAGSGLATFSTPSSNGVLASNVEYTKVLEYNSVEELERVFKKYPDDIACVVIEPFAGNMNLVKPKQSFITMLRELCNKFNTLLIFDEVMTGFRVGLGGAQEILQIKPDLTTLGKVIGGGMPLAAFGGKKEIMDKLSPLGDVYQAGTLSGNPIAVTAGLTNLKIIQQPGFYNYLASLTQKLTIGLNDLAKQYRISFVSDYVGGMFGIYFANTLPQDFNEAKQVNSIQYNQFFHFMLKHGIYFAPSMFEAGFVCYKHTDRQIDQTLGIADKAFKNMVD